MVKRRAPILGLWQKVAQGLGILEVTLKLRIHAGAAPSLSNWQYMHMYMWWWWCVLRGGATGDSGACLYSCTTPFHNTHPAPHVHLKTAHQGKPEWCGPVPCGRL
jgi:hypothetical protein